MHMLDVTDDIAIDLVPLMRPDELAQEFLQLGAA
jgi:hypothetical protein